MTEYEDMVVGKKHYIMLYKFHHLAAKLKLVNHNSFSITTTIMIFIILIDVFMLIPNLHNHANLWLDLST